MDFRRGKPALHFWRLGHFLAGVFGILLFGVDRGDFADQSLVIAHKDGNTYVGTREGGMSDKIGFLSWDGSGFSSEITFEANDPYDVEEGFAPYEYGINGEAVTGQEYTELRGQWPHNSWPKWREDFEVYAPYGMAEGGSWYGEDNSGMIASAKQAIAETKAALGLSGEINGGAQEGIGYTGLLSSYGAVLEGAISINDAEIDLSESDLWLSPSALPRIDENGYFISDGSSTFYYTVSDLNGDQTDELIVMETTDYGSYILDIFTAYNGQPVWLAAGVYRSYIDICENGIIRNVGSGGAQASTYSFFAIQNGSLVTVETAEENWGDYTVNGETCNETEFQNAIGQYTPVSLDTFDWIVFTPETSTDSGSGTGIPEHTLTVDRAVDDITIWDEACDEGILVYLHNQADSSILGIELSITYYNSSGKSVASDTYTVPVIDSGGRRIVPFHQPSESTAYHINVTATGSSQYSSVTTVMPMKQSNELSWVIDDLDSDNVYFMLTNKSADDYGRVDVVALYYDNNDAIHLDGGGAVGFGSCEISLKAGESKQCQVARPDLQPLSYELFLYGYS